MGATELSCCALKKKKKRDLALEMGLAWEINGRCIEPLWVERAEELHHCLKFSKVCHREKCLGGTFWVGERKNLSNTKWTSFYWVNMGSERICHGPRVESGKSVPVDVAMIYEQVESNYYIEMLNLN